MTTVLGIRKVNSLACVAAVFGVFVVFVIDAITLVLYIMVLQAMSCSFFVIYIDSRLFLCLLFLDPLILFISIVVFVFAVLLRL